MLISDNYRVHSCKNSINDISKEVKELKSLVKSTFNSDYDNQNPLNLKCKKLEQEKAENYQLSDLENRIKKIELILENKAEVSFIS